MAPATRPASSANAPLTEPASPPHPVWPWPHPELVAKPPRRDQSGQGALALQEGVGAYRGAVNEAGELLMTGLIERIADTTADILTDFVRNRQNLVSE